MLNVPKTGPAGLADEPIQIHRFDISVFKSFNLS